MAFVLLQLGIEVDAVSGNVDFFRAPEERELFLNQLFEVTVLLLIVACYVDRLAEEHRFLRCVVSAQTESRISHVFPLNVIEWL